MKDIQNRQDHQSILMSDWKDETMQKNLLLVHLNLHGHSNQHAADIEMISIKMAEIAERPHKIKKSIDLKDHLIQAKTLEI